MTHHEQFDLITLIWCDFCVLSPENRATLLKNIYHAENKYYVCIKTGLLAHLSGYAPAISVEYARNVCGLDGADSTEVDEAAPHKVIYKLRDLLGFLLMAVLIVASSVLGTAAGTLGSQITVVVLSSRKT